MLCVLLRKALNNMQGQSYTLTREKIADHQRVVERSAFLIAKQTFALPLTASHLQIQFVCSQASHTTPNMVAHNRYIRIPTTDTYVFLQLTY